METVKTIQYQLGENCEVDVDALVERLAKLPADMFIELQRKITARIYGYPNFGGCCGGIEEKKSELKAKIDYSELDEKMEKVEEINKAAEKFQDLIEELAHKHVPIYIDVVEKGE